MTTWIRRAVTAGLVGLVPLLAGCPDNSSPSSAAPKAWQLAQLIETDNAGDAELPQVAFDGSGHAIAVWRQHDGSRTNTWANRYVVGTGWGTAQLIETDNAGDIDVPQVAMDGSGNAIAVWRQFDGTRANIMANRYVAATNSWGMAELIETDNAGHAGVAQVAMDSSGNAIAVWRQSDGSRQNIWANRYVVGTGWGTAQLIETDNADSAEVPQIAMDGSGNAIAVWMQSDGTRWNTWANRYVVGSGWGVAQLIETDNAGGTNNPQVAVDSSGNAVAVWNQSDGTRLNIWANHYVVGSGWGTAQLIETDNAGGASNPWVAVDRSGNAVAVWNQSDGTRNNIWANRYVAATNSWGTAQLIETDNAGDALVPEVVMDSSGNAVAAWTQSDGTRNNIWTNRYVAATNSWGTAHLLETDDVGAAVLPRLAVDRSGNVVAVWSQHDGTRYNIWANHYR